MRLMQYDNKWFRIHADAIDDGNGNIVGHWPGFSTALEVPPWQANSAADKSMYGWVPIGVPKTTDSEAYSIAAAAVRLNWDAKKTDRQFKTNDKVGQTNAPGNQPGIVVAPPAHATINMGMTFVKFGNGPPDEVSTASLIFLP